MILSGPGQRVTNKPSDDIKRSLSLGARRYGCVTISRQRFYLAVITKKNSIS